MNIDTQAILRFLNQQKEIVKITRITYDEKEGMINAFNLVKDYLELYEKQLGEDMAKYEEKHGK